MLTFDPHKTYFETFLIALTSLELLVAQIEVELCTRMSPELIAWMEHAINSLLQQLNQQEKGLLDNIEADSDEVMDRAVERSEIIKSIIPLIQADTTYLKQLVTEHPNKVSDILKEEEETNVKQLRLRFSELRTIHTRLHKRFQAL